AVLLPSKRLVLEIGRRLVDAGHLDDAAQMFHLSAADVLCYLLEWWDGTGARELATERAQQGAAWLAEEAPPDVITEEADGRVAAAAPLPVHEGDTWD